MQKVESSISKILSSHLVRPMLQHRWTIEFQNSGLTKEAKDAMTANSENVKMDFIKKTISFNIRQPAIQTELALVIADFVTSGHSAIKVNSMDGSDGVYGYWIFENLKAETRHFDLDYAMPGVAKHEIVMKYSRMISNP